LTIIDVSAIIASMNVDASKTHTACLFAPGAVNA
jgi:hypothetical protein